MFRVSDRKKVSPTFKPCLEPLEERYMLDASQAVALPILPSNIQALIQLQNDEYVKTIDSLLTLSNQDSGQQNLSPVTALRNDYNQLGIDAATGQVGKSLQDVSNIVEQANILGSTNLGDVAVQEANQLPPGLQRGGADVGILIESGFEAVLGGLELSTDEIKSAVELGSKAVQGYVDMIKQQADHLFNLSNVSPLPETLHETPSSGTTTESLIYVETAPPKEP